jgi:hypothetical protein
MEKTKKETDSDSLENQKRQINIGVIIAVCVVLIAFAANWFFQIDEKFDARGTFGDSFGVVNALFSGLAFIGVVYAVLLQQLEVKMQRHELELTRKVMQAQQKELADQREEMQRQNSFFAQQTFENTFFKMLENLRNNYRNIKYGSKISKEAIYLIHHDIFSQSIYETSSKNLKQQINMMNHHIPYHLT